MWFAPTIGVTEQFTHTEEDTAMMICELCGGRGDRDHFIECAYCNSSVPCTKNPSDAIEWDAVAALHDISCEWVETRAHTLAPEGRSS